MKETFVSWFSAGVSSAVATKLVIDKVDRIIYVHINDQHDDSLRFIKDCEQWFQKKVEIIQSEKFKNVEEVCLYYRFIMGPKGGRCTGELKKNVRKAWECKNRFFNYFTYVWGFDCSTKEKGRAKRLANEQFEAKHVFPLIENNITKQEAHGIIESAGIRRPKMYDLGYENNNCIGCLKGGMAYWNKIRVDFPDVFKTRAKTEREIGGTSIKGVYLDELDPNAGRGQKPIVPECGFFCNTQQESW